MNKVFLLSHDLLFVLTKLYSTLYIDKTVEYTLYISHCVNKTIYKGKALLLTINFFSLSPQAELGTASFFSPLAALAQLYSLLISNERYLLLR